MSCLGFALIVVILFGIVTAPSFATDSSQSEIFRLTTNNNVYDIHYVITGSSLKNMLVDEEAGALLVEIGPSSNGTLTIEIPRKLMDWRHPNCEDEPFFVLINGAETRYTETKNNKDRTLAISFSKGSKEIEILGTTGVMMPGIKRGDECPPLEILPPIRQIANGVLPKNVVCKEGLELIFKSKDNSPVCVKPQTTVKLLERGWATTHVDLTNKESNKDKTMQQLNEEYGYVPGELIILLKKLPSTGENSSFHNRMINLIPNYEDIVIREIPELSMALIRVPVGEEQNYLEMLKQYPDVKAVELNRISKMIR